MTHFRADLDVIIEYFESSKSYASIMYECQLVSLHLAKLHSRSQDPIADVFFMNSCRPNRYEHEEYGPCNYIMVCTFGK